MRRVLPIAALAAAVLTATVAEAAVSHGNFAGKTSAKDPIGFTIDSTGRLSNFYYEGVHMRCTDGDAYDTLTGADRAQTRTKKFKVDSQGRFSVKVSTNGGASSWTASGRFASSGTQASGTLSVHARYNIENQLDPKGTIRCDSGKLTFTVSRR